MPNYLITRPRWESDVNLPLESQEVIRAIARTYAVGVDNAECTDFTPCDVLYEKYFRDHKLLDRNSQGKLMNRTEFGAVFRRMFALKDQEIAATRLRVNGKRVRGYRYVFGPGSVKVHAEPGPPGQMAKFRERKKAMYREKYGPATNTQTPSPTAAIPDTDGHGDGDFDH